MYPLGILVFLLGYYICMYTLTTLYDAKCQNSASDVISNFFLMTKTTHLGRHAEHVSTTLPLYFRSLLFHIIIIIVGQLSKPFVIPRMQ